MRKKAIFLTVVLAVLLSACTITVHKGFYEGLSASGWRHSVDPGSGGVNSYQPQTKPPFPFEVTFSTVEHGTIYLAIYYPKQAPVFVSKDVIVAFANGREDRLDAKGSMLIDVSPSEAFTITVPPFRLNGVDFPQLEAAFKWNKERKYYVRSLQ